MTTHDVSIRPAGAHVASSAYVVSPPATGRGIAQVMCEHSLVRARSSAFWACS